MLKKMAYHIGGVSLVLSVIMAFASLSSLFLGRLLSDTDFGEFSLIRMLVLFLPFLAIWGQGIATARYFSKHPPSEYDWPAAMIKILAVSAGLTLIGVVGAMFIYRLSLPASAALFVAVLFFCSTLFLANLMRSQRHYVPAVLMENGYRGLFFFVLMIAYFTIGMDKTSAMGFYLGLVVVMGCFNLWYGLRRIPSGSRSVPAEMHKAGIILMGVEVSVDVLSSLDTLIIPKILDYASLGLYAAVLVPAQLFNILARATKYVWVPEFGRNERTRFRLLTAGVALFAMLLAVLLVVTAEPLLHLLYKGKYDAGTPLLKILAVTGVFRLMYSLSSSLIVGRLGQKALVAHLRYTIVSMILYFFLLIGLLRSQGVVGAAWALLIITLIRAVLSYWVVMRFQHERG
ncbi:hypothetical protein GX408_14040 [bacterium]|nr:hypothetical protein [bacterium]